MDKKTPEVTPAQGTTLSIKNMVCPRCIMAVEQVLARLGLTPLHVELGKAVVRETPDEAMLARLRTELEALGFELLDDRRMQLIEQVRNAVIELVHYRDSELRTNLSDYLTARLHHDYSALSKLFSEVTGTTIEKYFIAQKIERVKELLVYDELSLGEIAARLNYSSTAHLSAQFKSVTGMTPTRFKQEKRNLRRTLDSV